MMQQVFIMGKFALWSFGLRRSSGTLIPLLLIIFFSKQIRSPLKTPLDDAKHNFLSMVSNRLMVRYLLNYSLVTTYRAWLYSFPAA